jgi:hypothetical protein
MSVYRIVMQQAATHNAEQATTPTRAITVDAAGEGRQITIDEHGIVVGPRKTAPPALPGSGHVPPGGMDNIIPAQAVDIAYGFFIMCAVMVIGWPLARAFGRRIERRADTAVVDPAVSGQLQRIEQAVDAMAIEIERISESQRFLTRLQSGPAERGAVPSVERR